MRRFNVGDLVWSAQGSLGEIVHIVNEVEGSDDPKCIVITGFPFEDKEEIIQMSELSEYVPTEEVSTQKLPF